MPTKLPRVLVTLSPQLHAAVERAATAAGSSKSALIAGLLEPSAPVLVRMAEVMEAAAAAPEEARQGMARALDRGIAAVVPLLDQAVERGSEQLGQVAALGKPAKRAARAPAPGRRVRSSRTPA